MQLIMTQYSCQNAKNALFGSIELAFKLVAMLVSRDHPGGHDG